MVGVVDIVKKRKKLKEIYMEWNKLGNLESKYKQRVFLLVLFDQWLMIDQ